MPSPLEDETPEPTNRRRQARRRTTGVLSQPPDAPKALLRARSPRSVSEPGDHRSDPPALAVGRSSTGTGRARQRVRRGGRPGVPVDVDGHDVLGDSSGQQRAPAPGPYRGPGSRVGHGRALGVREGPRPVWTQNLFRDVAPKARVIDIVRRGRDVPPQRHRASAATVPPALAAVAARSSPTSAPCRPGSSVVSAFGAAPQPAPFHITGLLILAERAITTRPSDRRRRIAGRCRGISTVESEASVIDLVGGPPAHSGAPERAASRYSGGITDRRISLVRDSPPSGTWGTQVRLESSQSLFSWDTPRER
jgi:hypothetical protein